MTSKEALLALYAFVAIQVPKEKMNTWTEYLDAIKNDLEISNIFKKNLVIEIDDKPLWDGTYGIDLKEEDDDCLEDYTRIYVSEEEKDLLKEWAKNGS